MNLNVKLVKDFESIDKRSGRVFKYDRFFTVVNGIEVRLIAEGTAYDVLLDALSLSGSSLPLGTSEGSFEVRDSSGKTTGELRPYDTLFVKLGDEEVPISSDRYGKRLIIKALKQK